MFIQNSPTKKEKDGIVAVLCNSPAAVADWDKKSECNGNLDEKMENK